VGAPRYSLIQAGEEEVLEKSVSTTVRRRQEQAAHACCANHREMNPSVDDRNCAALSSMAQTPWSRAQWVTKRAVLATASQLVAERSSVLQRVLSSRATQLLPRWSWFCAGARLGPAPETSDSWVRHTNQRQMRRDPTCQAPLPIRPCQMSNRDCPPRARLLAASGDEME
jgi:hypothetical protein